MDGPEYKGVIYKLRMHKALSKLIVRTLKIIYNLNYRCLVIISKKWARKIAQNPQKWVRTAYNMRVNEMKVKLKDGREVTIRPVTPEDKGGLFALFSSMSEEALRWSMAPYTPDRIQRWIESLPNLIFIAAVHGGRIVGQATVNKFTHPRRRGVAEFGIYLHQDYHNVGLGTAMTKILLKQAGEQGIHKVNLETVAENEPAHRLFRKLGFAEEGRIKDSYLGEDGRFHDIILMGKIIEKTPL